jgi:hypothetical protein
MALFSASCQLVIGDLPPELSFSAKDGSTPDHAPLPDAPAEATRDVVTERDTLDAPAESGDAGVDAPTDPPDADPDPCTTLVPWYNDMDGDGIGRYETEVVACPRPEGGPWVRKYGDCNDGDANVHPGQTAYFGKPFTLASGAESFDYDCSGAEEPNPGQARIEACGPLANLGLCDKVTGYASGSRFGPGIDKFCGSTTLILCDAILLDVLVCTFIANDVTDEPFRCR